MMRRRPAPKFSDRLHFVTARTNHGVRLFRNPTLCKLLLESLGDARRRAPFGLHAYVFMPDHVHLVVQPPDGRISDLMRRIKALSARRILAVLKQRKRPGLLERLRRSSKGKKGHTYQVWQQGFHTVELWRELFIKKKIDYLHANPLRAGLVKSAKEYPWSSFRAFHALRREEFDLPVDAIPW